MTRPHHFTHRDANQAQLVADLRALGYYVEDISTTCAWADILVWGYDWNAERRLWRAMEVKTPTGKLTTAEQAMQDEWSGAVDVVRTVEEVLAAFGRGIT